MLIMLICLLPVLIAFLVTTSICSIFNLGNDAFSFIFFISVFSVYALLMVYTINKIKANDKSNKTEEERRNQDRIDKQLKHERLYNRSKIIYAATCCIERTEVNSKEEEEVLRELDKMNLSYDEWNSVRGHGYAIARELRPKVKIRAQNAFILQAREHV